MDTNTLPIPAAIDIRGIRLNNLAMEDALNAIDGALATKTPVQIAFVNADCVNLAANDPAYQATLEAMDWIFIDGIGMKIAGKLLHQPVRANVNGTDLFPRLCAELGQNGRRIFLLGAQPGIADAAAEWAKNHHPGLVIAGTQNGYINEAETPAVLERIRAARADVLFVAMGAPRQENWIQKHAAACGATVTIGVGGLFDYYSGNIPRAPLWMRCLGLEWLYRLLQEPGRLWKRYLLGNWMFMARVTTDRLRQLLSGKNK
jgi:N-acetylglucosaminyldiphosphoundecaprenol N-acetyl-beta-D-mannosaminyltransferase